MAGNPSPGWPYTAETGIVGQSVGMYSVYLGGSPMATRLGRLYQDRVPQAKLAEVLRPVFAEYAERREPGEAFGDYCYRAGYGMEVPCSTF